MSVILVASAEPRMGRSLVAAAIARRIARDGGAATLARLTGDDSAAEDAATFATLEAVVSPGTPVSEKDVQALAGDVVLEAPPGPVSALARALGGRVLEVGGVASPAMDAAPETLIGRVLTRVPAAQAGVVAARANVIAVLAEDRVLAAPSLADIAAATGARWLAGAPDAGSIEQIMIGTVASDAAEPYFGNRRRTCVVTRFDKTDIQLAALQTDLECLVITGGGEPSPYLLDRVRGARDEVAVLAAPGSTVETVRAIEGLYAASRFDGASKLERAIELLDAAGVPVAL
ncbi:MAG TPA: DRTGG domain-containing protein [Dehalococcoidia bacterium]|nr:DRTGG domain-containing protein [Dehalococcoidia bacterium]